MPKLSAYEQQVTAQPVNAGSVPIESFTGGWKTATETFGVLDETVKQFKKVQDFNQESDATLGLMEEVDAIKQEAANERDPSKLAEYKSKIDSAIGKNANKITDGLLKTQVKQKLALSGYKAFGDIRSDFRAKEIDLGQAKYMTLMDKYSRAYSEASDDVSRKVIRQSMNDMMDSSIKSGLFDDVDIQKMRQVNEKELDKRDLAYDIQNIPDQVDNRYKNGSYSSLTPEEVDKGIALAQRMEEKRRKEIEVANKKMMIQNERSITQEMASGQGKSISEISDMVSDGEISQEFGQAYVMYLTSPDSIDPANDKNGFAKYAENVFSSKDDTQINNAIKMALEGGSDGKISRDDLKYLIKYASDRGNRLTQKNPIQDTIDSAWKTLTDWFSEKSPKNKNTATAEFIKTIASDENADPVKTTQTIINRESVNRNPHVTAIPKEGKIMVDKFGNKARVFPDGSHQEVK